MDTTGHRPDAPRGRGESDREATRRAVGAAGAHRPEPRLVGPPPRSTPAHWRSRRSHWRRLPDDLLRQASRRLEIIALLAAGLWSRHGALPLRRSRGRRASGCPSSPPTPSPASAWRSRSRSSSTCAEARRDPRFVLDLGLAYMVAMAFITGVIQHWDPLPHSPTMPMFSWNGISVLLFAAMLPSDPTRTAVAGLIAVSMNPVGMLIARARGTWQFESTLTAWTMHYPDFLIVGVSLVVSRVVWGLGQQVARAREMGSYQLGDLIGRGGMGEVYKATHRMLARPAAIKLIRPRDDGRPERGAGRDCDRAFPPRSGGCRAVAIAAHGRPLRFRHDRGRRSVFRDGIPGWDGSRVRGAADGAPAGGPRRAHPEAGL